jgi:hypothetical protein
MQGKFSSRNFLNALNGLRLENFSAAKAMQENFFLHSRNFSNAGKKFLALEKLQKFLAVTV